MSMVTESFCIPVGFFVDNEVAAHVWLMYNKAHNRVKPDIQKIIDDGLFDAMARAGTLPGGYGVDCELFDILVEMPVVPDCAYASSMDGSIKTMTGGHPAPFDLTVEEETVICIPAQKEPSLFSAAYGSFQELVDEFKEIFVGILPDDFDYVKHIVVIDGTDFH